MLKKEVNLVQYGFVGFFRENGSPATNDDHEIEVGPGVEFGVPLELKTLTALVLSRHAAGKYTTEQARQWFLIEGGAESYLDEAQSSDQFTDDDGEPYTFVTIPESQLREWLLAIHQQGAFQEDGTDEENDEGAVDALSQFLPDWVEYDLGDVGGMTGGSGGTLIIPAGRTLEDMLDAAQRNIDEYLRKLEPQMPKK